MGEGEKVMCESEDGLGTFAEGVGIFGRECLPDGPGVRSMYRPEPYESQSRA